MSPRAISFDSSAESGLPDHPEQLSAPSAPPGRIHRAWLIAALGFAVITCAGTFTGLPNLLVNPLREDFGWSHGTISVAISVNTLLYGVTAPFAAALMDRIGVRRVVVAALVIIAAGAGLTTVITAPWQLVLCWGVMVGLGCGSIAMAFGALIADRWFAARKGLVTGFLSSATMFGGMVLLPLLSGLTNTRGWRTATLTVAATAGVVAIVTLCFLRDHPADVRLAPYGAAHPVPKPAPVLRAGRRALRVLVSSLRAPAFWLVAGAFAICGASTNGVMMTHFVPAAHDHGMPSMVASSLLAVMGVVNVAGTIAAGWCSDRLDPRWMLAGIFTLRGISLVFLPLLFDPSVTAAMLFFALSFGLLDLATVPPVIALCREHFGTDSTIVFAWVNATHQVGAGLTTLAAGVLRDATGSYTVVWFAVAALCAFAAMLSTVVRRPSSHFRTT